MNLTALKFFHLDLFIAPFFCNPIFIPSSTCSHHMLLCRPLLRGPLSFLILKSSKYISTFSLLNTCSYHQTPFVVVDHPISYFIPSIFLSRRPHIALIFGLSVLLNIFLSFILISFQKENAKLEEKLNNLTLFQRNNTKSSTQTSNTNECTILFYYFMLCCISVMFLIWLLF